MSTPVIGVTPDATIEEAAAVVMAHGFTTLPVLGYRGRLMGLVTEAEFVRARLTPSARTVRMIMRSPVYGIPADSDVADLATAMVDSHLRCVPVVDGHRVIGMVSWRDVLSTLIRGN